MEELKIKKLIKYIIILLLITVMLISSYFLYKNLQEDNKQEEIFEEIKVIAEDNNDDKNNDINMKKLYEINSDIVGWIRIDNSNIDYPVMQTKNSPNYYLRKNFYKEYSYLGTPYLAESCDINISDNLIIYGHNIDNSKMFGGARRL